MIHNTDTIGVVRDHRWVRAAEQRRRLEADGCRVILEFDTKRQTAERADVVRMIRPGTEVKLAYAFLLADPVAKKKKGGMKSDFDAVLAMIEKRGGFIKDLETGLTTEKREHRRAVVALSHNHIARSNQGLKSSLNGTKSRGRPRVWEDPATRKVLWEEWHSTEHRTNKEAVAAASAKLGKVVYYHTMWRVVREMRRAKGKTDAGGASGRLPGNPILREKAKGRRQRVYFIRCGDMVKIGYSGTVSSRYTNIKVSSPHQTELLGTVPGSNELERKLHRRFSEYHARGEWFRIEGKLASFLKRLPKSGNS